MLSTGQIIELCQHATGVTGEIVHSRRTFWRINAPDWPGVAQFLRFDPQVEFDWLRCLTGIDYAAKLQLAVVYDLRSTRLGQEIAVKVVCPRDAPTISSVIALWPSAGWHEREAFDLLGIEFSGHPDLRRILLSDDWVGHPLRKDYLEPQSYDGIPTQIPPGWDGLGHDTARRA